jgi:hypothetical protein
MQNSQPNRTIDEFESIDQQVHAWEHREQMADVMNKEARHLVRMAGSLELAKQAIDAVQREQAMPAAAKQELAHDLGYTSVRQMMEQTELVQLPTGAYTNLTTDSDGYWVAWNDKPYYDIQRFESRQSALLTLRENADSILFGS